MEEVHRSCRELEEGYVWLGGEIFWRVLKVSPLVMLISKWRIAMKGSHTQELPWLVRRDLNEITYGFEKVGGLPRDERRMEAFRRVLEDCQLIDMGWSGNLPETNVKERLDRGVANVEWMGLFPCAMFQHLPHSFSDHCPLFIRTDQGTYDLARMRFHFEALWVMEDSFEGVVGNIWESTSGDLLNK
ncbi:reverse transcriptase [Gossypium australe]|uniref:Reverse transcriptase n=1 Tax=Gossypium australe TaxID=47621 RepID=A0A5B6VML8_9ROSI|nr:reverse transcriptase [Gossypium australe]